MESFEYIDGFYWDKERKNLKFPQHHIVGLQNFAHFTLSKADKPLPLHFHANIIEFHCLLKGRKMTVLNGETYTVAGGECFFTLPFEQHGSGQYPQNPYEFYSFQIDLSPHTPEGILGLNKDLSKYLVDSITALPYRHYRMSYADQQNLKCAFECAAQGTLDRTYLAIQHLNTFLFNLGNLPHVEQQAPPEISGPIQLSLDYIEKNFREVTSLEELAGISGYSLSAFKNKFKAAVGMTPAEYLTIRKIEYAKQQLAAGNSSVTDLAYELGFSSSNYFCSVFKKFTNATPSEYGKKTPEKK